MIVNLHHIQIAVPKKQEETARAFYCGILGFSEVVKPREMRGRGGLWFEAQNIQLHLVVEGPFTPAKKRPIRASE